ncbi:MAG: signal recognition particle-docking protein FtsY [Desulfurococcaceae archaeon]|nr:signal recognition particle-docking protein FtsY [Sulfolobales archaeon]MDW8170827.1 signal recognition particle-docking protein FtsY [Desulfurococcaceae archaeon]
MFEKLKKAISSFSEKVSRALYSKKELEKFIYELELQLVENDVAYEAVVAITSRLRKLVEDGALRDRDDVLKALGEAIIELFKGSEAIDVFAEARRSKLYKVIFLGVNGVGKTTTIAKVAKLFRDRGFKPLMVAADTFRAGAQEQLKVHGERLGIPVFIARYGVSPAAIAFDSIAFAEKRGYNVLLIDTAGRMHVDQDLVEELKKIVRVVKPHRKVLVIDALTGNDAVEQAKKFNEAVGVDAVIIAKADACERGGVPISIAYSIKKPIIYLGTGQGYSDLEEFSSHKYVEYLLK